MLYKRARKFCMEVVFCKLLPKRSVLYPIPTSSNMSKIFVLLSFVSFLSSSMATLTIHGEPLFTGATSFTFEVSTMTVTKPTPCYITSGEVSLCRRKRGLEEIPQISPSAVVGVETTPAPRFLRSGFNFNNKISSSFDDSYASTLNIFRQLEAKGRNNAITVGNCGMSTVNFSEFLSCLGMTVQQTTTLTATFTETSTLSSGYTTMTVLGCLPTRFPYEYCLKEKIDMQIKN